MARGSKLQDHIEIELKEQEFAAAYLASVLDEGVVLKALSDKIVSNPLSFGLTLGVDCRAIQESIFNELGNEMTKTKKNQLEPTEKLSSMFHLGPIGFD